MKARQYRALYTLLALLLLAAGCSRSVEDLVARPAAEDPGHSAGNPPPSPPPAPPPAPAPTTPVDRQPDTANSENETPLEPPALPPTPNVSVPEETPPPPPPPTSPVPSPGEPAAGLRSIRLSAGVALPQTLPTGTAMGFSVDYEFTRGRPNPASPYVWVIEPGKGQPAKFAARLANKSTLQVFVPHWRPENGPFQSHIEDTAGNRLSRSIPLR